MKFVVKTTITIPDTASAQTLRFWERVMAGEPMEYSMWDADSARVAFAKRKPVPPGRD